MKIIFEVNDTDREEYEIENWSVWFKTYRTVRDILEKGQ